MKTLILVRHAKSSWKDAYLLDIDRPLNKRGQRDAPMMGKRLAERGSMPDLMISSPANRAFRTAEIIAQEIEYPLEDIVVDERIYGADVDDWFQVVHDLDDGWDCVMCFGHNPGLTDFFNHISSYYINNVPTCGIIEMMFDVDAWEDVGRVEPVDVHYDYPKNTDVQD